MINSLNPKIQHSSPPYLLSSTLRDHLPDFWSRQTHAQTESFEFTPFGIPARITANQPEVLAAARLSAGRFSLFEESKLQFGLQKTTLIPQPPTPFTNPQPATPIHIQLVVTGNRLGSVPADLPERLTYAGVGEWISLSAGEWGYAFANLPTRTAVAFLSPALAAETRLVSRYVIDHYLLNFILTEWAMLHASCVLDPSGQRLILMVAPHNTGKSTTALHLLRAGYIFLADGMALLRQSGAGFIVGGYPIGEVKLRDDVLALFPNYTGEVVKVREQSKMVVNLRVVHPDCLAETLFVPSSIQLCFVERSETRDTQVSPLSPTEAASLLVGNTVYWDEPNRLAHNTTILSALLEIASSYHLEIGSGVEGIITALGRLE
jgi:hypothetical protein